MRPVRTGISTVTVIAVTILCTMSAVAQNIHAPTRHAEDRAQHPEELYRQAQLELPEALPMGDVPRISGAPFNVVYGWYPYWTSSSAASAMRADLLTHVAWFSVGVDTATGALGSLESWKNTQVVQWAKGKGLKVHLTITCFGSKELRALLSSDTKRARCIAEIAAAVAMRSADGVNIDFESLPSSERTTMVAFMQGLRSAMPNKELTMATPSVDWNKSWDLKALSEISDFLVIMGYDYYWSGSTTAGPVAPLRGETYTVAKSIDAHLASGVSPSRLAVAMPLYGRTWTVSSTARKGSVVTGTTSTTPTYSSAQSLPGMSSRLFDGATSVAWFNNEAAGVIKQTWIDDSASLAAKYQYVKSKGLRGIGYWALGYDGGQRSMWDGLASVSTSTDVAERTEPSDDDSLGRTVQVYTLVGQHVFTGTILELHKTLLPSGVLVIRDGHSGRLILR